MQFAYTPEQLALRERAGRLTDQIISFEGACETGLLQFGAQEAVAHA